MFFTIHFPYTLFLVICTASCLLQDLNQVSIQTVSYKLEDFTVEQFSRVTVGKMFEGDQSATYCYISRRISTSLGHNSASSDRLQQSG